MHFDSNNKIVKFCAKGMELEAAQRPAEAQELFLRAWNEAANDFEKFTAAHYVARHQTSVNDKLEWDKKALAFALKIDDNAVAASYPSLYLKIAKCYEDANDLPSARANYEKALSYANNLPDNGYGRMIEAGIKNGLERLSKC